MILPILISPSLAPGSYFFCAFAAVTLIAAAANAARTTKLRIKAGIALSLWVSFAQLLQLAHRRASISLFRGAKQDCWPLSIMIDAWRHLSLARPTAWNPGDELVHDI